MEKTLRILLVEDSDSDARLLELQLRRDGYAPAIRRVETAEAMSAAIESGKWDVVISDYVLPQFSGLNALAIYRRQKLDIPFIMMSGKMGEELAVAAMKSGAHDYILKDNLRRVAPAIERELSDAEERRRRRQAEAELEQYRKHLEQLVEKRTSELQNLTDELKDDMAQRLVAERSLSLSEARYRTLVEASPDGIITIDESRRIGECNEGICSLLGLPRKAILGRQVDEFFSVPPAQIALLSSGAQASDILEEGELEARQANGDVVPVWSRLATLPGEGSAGVRTIMYLRDVSERKKVEQLKDNFIGLVSHELRTPLTIILGALNVITTEGHRLPADEATMLMRDAIQEAEALSHLIDNMVDLSRAQANQIILSSVPLEIGDTVSETVAKVGRRYPKQHFRIQIDPDLPAVRGDKMSVQQVLRNLLENAAVYSPPGSEIRTEVRRSPEGMMFMVKDQGPGIPPQDQARLFQPFERLAGRGESRAPGLGLGLVVCRRLVDAHGGRVGMESEPGIGSTFWFTLPVAQPHPDPTPRP